MRMRTIVMTALVGTALAAATVLQARGAAGTRTTVARVPAPASLGVAAEGRIVTYPGAEVVVAAERGGRLVSLRVQEGQAVRKGEVLAEIDADELRAALAAARARVEEAEAEARLAELNRERRRRLVAERIAATHDLDEAVRDLEIAQARTRTARAEAERLEAELRKTRILSPLTGTVTHRGVDAGETVEAGDPIATVADLSRLRVDAEADEADAGVLVVGAPVEVSADGYPGRRWRGRVEEIAESVTLRRLKPQDPGRPTDTRILAVKVALSEPTPLKLGATVELRIQPPGR